MVGTKDDTEFGEDYTPLHYAAYNGHCDVLVRAFCDYLLSVRRLVGVSASLSC